MVLALNDFAGQFRRPGTRPLDNFADRTANRIRLTSVLVVADNQPATSVINSILQTSGYSITHVSDMSEAISYLSDAVVDLVLVDSSEPSFNLAEFQQMRTSFPSVSTLAILSRRNMGLAKQICEVGVTDYVTQPLDLNDLLFRMRLALTNCAEQPWTEASVLPPPSTPMLTPPIEVAPTPSSATLTPPTPETALVTMKHDLSITPTPPPLTINCFGQFKMMVNGRLVCDDNTGGRRAMLLLKYLIFNIGRHVRKERIADLLWPDLSGDYASNNLRGTIHSLRQHLIAVGLNADQFIRTERGSITFDPGPDYYYDVEHLTLLLDRAGVEERAGRFKQAIASYEEANLIYQGSYLELDSTVEWVIYEQNSLRERFMGALIRLADLYIETQEYDRAATIAQRVIHDDWRREAAHRLLMVARYKLGQRNHALIAYQNVVDTFKEHLGILPMQQTRDLAARILREEQL